jgi:small-conductance mechanosensitive channel
MARGQSDADYERVNSLVAGGMKKMQAFAAVAEERGISANGVRVNYYNASRKARSSSAKLRRTTRNAAERSGVTPPSSSVPPDPAAIDGAGSIDGLAARLVASAQALTTAVRAQNRELEELRRRVDQARAALR